MINKYFNPIYYIIAYLGLSITTLHLEIELFTTLHLELILFLGILLTTVIYFYQNKIKITEDKHLVYSLIFSFIFILLPAIASFWGTDYLNILGDGEYRTLAKILLICPVYFWFLKKEKNSDLLLNSILFFYALFAMYFLYRYLILNEVREFDLRPTLKIRHGDPNFLCLFFASTLPLAVYKLTQYFKNNQWLHSCVTAIVTLLLTMSVILTQSRMGLIALAIGLGYLLYKAPFKSAAKAFFMVTVALVALSATVLKPDISQRFSSINDKSSSDRLLTYENGIKAFFASPVLGVGMHEAKKTFYENSQYPEFQSEAKKLEIHSTYLNFLAELGAVGLFFFIGFLFWIFNLIRTANSPIKIYLMSSFLIILLSMLTVGVSYKDLLYVNLFLLAGLALKNTVRNKSYEIN